MRKCVVRRAVVMLLGLALLAGCGGSAASEIAVGSSDGEAEALPDTGEADGPGAPGEAPEPSDIDPDTPVESPAGGADGGEGLPEPELREPVASATDARPVTIESFEVRDDRTVRAIWWGGVEPCHVLADVEVDETDDEVRVRVLAGNDAGPEESCIMVALPLAVDIQLERDLGDRALVDASTGERPEVRR